MSLTLDSPLTLIPGVGPMRAAQLQELGLETIKDLLYYAPFRYETVEREVRIADLVPDATVCVKAEVLSKIPIRTPRFKSMLKVRVKDESGILDLTWFNNQFILSSLKIGETYYFTGKVGLFGKKPALTNPTVETKEPAFGSLVPIYHESADINSRYLRKLIRFAFENIDLSDPPEMIPVYTKHSLVSLSEAFASLHQISEGQREKGEGEANDSLLAARKRLAFDEMYGLIKNVMEQKRIHRESQSIVKLSTTNDDIKAFFALLPYTPTISQREAIQAISLDLVQPHPMHRLIQGEVGSGKTTVAAFALWVASRQGKKAILICPTNILAQQHFQTLQRFFGDGIGLYTGKEKNTDSDILVGTHALFHVKNLKPAVVIIDEEHRFGVAQRETFFKLKKKPHFLSMTATPIPRTVALTALSDRDVSFITSHKDNSNIQTWVVAKQKRTGAYDWIKKTLKETGGQALIVCPFIEESFVETLSTVKSAKKEYDSLQKVFTGFKLDLLHGKRTPADKDKLFAKVMAGKTDILVTTPVVEVGVDIPKANIIIIEGAERYGLAQLHQLRGRVGRRGQNAFCLLFTSDGIESGGRLSFFAKSYDGNALAEYDLKHRGSGELLGIRQHGFDSLRFASWSDLKLIEMCKAELKDELQK
jgi:ATP-dependent DNA helicase RecG